MTSSLDLPDTPLDRSSDPRARLHARVCEAADQALDADAALRRLLRRSAEAEPVPADLPDRVSGLVAAREDAALQLGLAVLGWVGSGGVLSLDEPEAGFEAAADDPGFVDSASAADAAEERPPAAAPPSGLLQEAPAEPTEDDPTDEVANPTAPIAGAASLARLESEFGWSNALRDEPAVAVQTSMPRSIPQRLGVLRQARGAAVWRHELGLIEREVRDEDTWGAVSGEARRELLSLLVARARYLQDEVTVPNGEADGLRRVFGALTSRMEERDVGYVNGLALHQRPAAGSWWAESEVWWCKVAGRAGVPTGPSVDERLRQLESALAGGLGDRALVDRVEALVASGVSSDDDRLLALVVPRASAFEGSGRCKTLKSVLKARLQADEDAEAARDAQDPAVPAAVLARTRGRRAVLVGGDRRNRAMERIVGALELAEADWETGHNVRRIESLAERIKGGRLDLVVVLKRFVSHRVTDLLVPAAKARLDVDVVWVDGGYGVAAIVRALDT